MSCQGHRERAVDICRAETIRHGAIVVRFFERVRMVRPIHNIPPVHPGEVLREVLAATGLGIWGLPFLR